MRRSEALQGVRMIKFLDILGRYEALEFNQLEAAELLGVGERTFRRWCQRYEEDGEAGLLDRRLGKASGRRVPVDRADEVEALYRTRYPGFTAKHFHEHLVKDHRFNWSYTWTIPAVEGAFGEGPAPRCASAQASAPAIARHAAASGRVAASMACGAATARSDRDPG